jgi:propanol-preferring alcohol dehydrogenase
VAAIDIDPKKLALAKKLGASLLVNAREQDPAAAVQEKCGGVQGAVVTAVATQAFEQAIGMLSPGGTVAYIGLPGGKADQIRASISAIVNWELSVRGSNVGTRLDLQEAVDFALRGEVAAKIETAPLSAANAVLNRMRKGKIVGRVVLTIG